MRVEEKIDPELELEQAHDQDKVVALEEERVPEQTRTDEIETSALHFHELVSYIEALLRGESPKLALSWASTVEQQALELVREAIEGRSSQSIKWLFAEDRIQMLNQALAALQPALAVGFETATRAARGLYAQLAEQMTDFKQSMLSLTDAQEELYAYERERVMREGQEGEAKPGKPKPKPVDAGEVGDERPSTLAGPGPAVEKPTVPTTLVGPGPAVEKPAVPTTLVGPGPAIEKLPQPSTAWDGDADAPARPRR